MKKINLLFLLLGWLMISFNLSCKEDFEPVAGDWVFWTNKNIKSSGIQVKVYPGQSGTVTGTFFSEPGCGNSNCYTVDLATLGISASNRTGTFSYYAIDSLSPVDVVKWNGVLTVTEDNWMHCNSLLLQ